MSAIKLKQNEGNERLAVAEGVFDFVLFKFYFLSDVSSFCFPFSKRYMKEYAQSSTGSTMVAYTATFNKLIASALPINASTSVDTYYPTSAITPMSAVICFNFFI